MGEFGPGQVAVSVFADHSGQDLFKNDLAGSTLNTGGLSMDYGPWSFLQFGAFIGATQFNVEVPGSKRNQSDVLAFETNPSLAYGGSAKLATPRFFSRTTAMVGYGSATLFSAEDDARNVKKGIAYKAGGGVQLQFWPAFNMILGGEFYAIDGEQTSRLVTKPAPYSNSDQFRGLLGFEVYFPGKNRPFISLAFRPTGAVGWNDDYGLENASISLSLGSITSLPGKTPSSGLDDDSDF